MSGVEPITWGAILILLTIGGAVAKFYHSLRREFSTADEAARKEIEAAKEKTREVENNLANFKLTAAETYVNRRDLQGALTPLMDHVSRVQEGVDKIGTRFDRMLEAQASKPATRGRASNT